jgi:hypothetical protein
MMTDMIQQEVGSGRQESAVKAFEPEILAFCCEH